LVALKFGNDSYARGNIQKAQEIYQEALSLFTATRNMRGKGASLNNLGSVALSRGQFQEAKKFFEQAITCGEEKLNELRQTLNQLNGNDDKINKKKLQQEIQNLERVISDRKGNLVAYHLESKDFSTAFQLLESLLEDDKKKLYIKGCIVKQGNLGQFYLQQGELKSAERVFISALEFIRNKDVLYSLLMNQSDIDENKDENAYKKRQDDMEREIMEAEQRALLNLALLEEETWKQECQKSKSQDNTSNPTTTNNENMLILDTETLQKLESRYLEALTSLPLMHISTTNTILRRLKGLYLNNKLNAQVDLIVKMAQEHDFQLDGVHGSGNSSDGSSGIKRVVFCIDYSGSMSGMKIRSAVNNLTSIVDKYIFGQDSVMFVTFNRVLSTVLPMTKKENNEGLI
jgi:tetratricopeptide (TPR) repeat protein